MTKARDHLVAEKVGKSGLIFIKENVTEAGRIRKKDNSYYRTIEEFKQLFKAAGLQILEDFDFPGFEKYEAVRCFVLKKKM